MEKVYVILFHCPDGQGGCDTSVISVCSEKDYAEQKIEEFQLNELYLEGRFEIDIFEKECRKFD